MDTSYFFFRFHSTYNQSMTVQLFLNFISHIIKQWRVRDCCQASMGQKYLIIIFVRPPANAAFIDLGVVLFVVSTNEMYKVICYTTIHYYYSYYIYIYICIYTHNLYAISCRSHWSHQNVYMSSALSGLHLMRNHTTNSRWPQEMMADRVTVSITQFYTPISSNNGSSVWIILRHKWSYTSVSDHWKNSYTPTVIKRRALCPSRLVRLLCLSW